MFSSKFCELSKNTFFTEHLRTTVSGINEYQTCSRLSTLDKSIVFFRVSGALKNQFHQYSQYSLTLSWRRSQSYKNQFINLLCKSPDWFLYVRELCHEGLKELTKSSEPHLVKHSQRLITNQFYLLKLKCRSAILI